MKTKEWLALCGMMLLSAASHVSAQDLRERNYYYEILQPNHATKEKVEGFASERVKESLDRGLSVVPSVDGKGIYLSWRLLEQDEPGASFHVYRSVNGKTKRLTSKPIQQTCDFTDKQPVEGNLCIGCVL